MIPVTDLRAGKAFEVDGIPFIVIQYKHIKMGRGTASIKIKARNLKNSSIVEKTFISGAKVVSIETQLKKVQYLYQDGDDFCFMDPKTFNQFSLSSDFLDGREKFLKEGEEFKILFWNDKALSLELPISMVFKIKDTSPGVKGNSAVNSFKKAVLDNGLSLNVPLFINIGDEVKVDTRTGQYIERVS